MVVGRVFLFPPLESAGLGYFHNVFEALWGRRAIHHAADADNAWRIG
jgi:hypothetical protein